jgi:biofilm PGA synthesis N-glycosyltransferase PgaC
MKISILIAAYNEEDSIEGTLNNLLNQMYPYEYEIIVCVEGEDNTYKIVKKYQQIYPDIIKIIYNKERIGIAKAMNLMMKRATGDILFKNDADIRSINPYMLMGLAELFEDKKVGGVICQLDFLPILKSKKNTPIVNMIKKSARNPLLRGEYIINILATEYTKKFYPLTKIPWIPISIHAWRRELVPPMPENTLHDDSIIAYNILEKGYSIARSSDIFYFTRGPSTISDLFKQKRLGIVGWKQLGTFSNKYKVNMLRYYLHLGGFYLEKMWEFGFGIKDTLAFLFWLSVFSLSKVFSYFEKPHVIKSWWH